MKQLLEQIAFNFDDQEFEVPCERYQQLNKREKIEHSIECNGDLIAAILKLAIEDSTPNDKVFDKKDGAVSMFNSLAFEYSDAYFFIKSERVDPYLAVISVSKVAFIKQWQKQYQNWLQTTAREVAINIIDYMVYMSSQNISPTLRVDLVAFLKSKHHVYWSNIAGVNPVELRDQLLNKMNYKPSLKPLQVA